jgi:hypothetical protein
MTALLRGLAVAAVNAVLLTERIFVQVQTTTVAQQPLSLPLRERWLRACAEIPAN